MDGIAFILPMILLLVYIGGIYLAFRVMMAVLSIDKSIRRIADKLDKPE